MKLDKLIGKRVKVYTRRGFHFQGKIISSDDKFIEIEDEFKGIHKFVALNEIVDFDVL